MTDNSNDLAPVSVVIVARDAADASERVRFLGRDVDIQTMERNNHDETKTHLLAKRAMQLIWRTIDIIKRRLLHHN